MNADELIKKAFDGGGGILSGEGLFVLEGNVKGNELKVTPLNDFFIANLFHFAADKLRDSAMIGIFNSIEAAEEYAVYIRTMVKDEKGNIIN